MYQNLKYGVSMSEFPFEMGPIRPVDEAGSQDILFYIFNRSY